jgi:hypothetical protein
VTIRAADAIVGTINTSGANEDYWFGSHQGGNVTVTTVGPFKFDAITADGWYKGTVAIEQRDRNLGDCENEHRLRIK